MEFIAHIEALEAARAAIRGGEQSALESARRIALSLVEAAPDDAAREVQEAAQRLLDSPSEGMLTSIGALVEALRTEVPGSDQEGRGRLLIIDDDAVTAMLLEGRLADLGWPLTVASSLEEADRVLEEETVALVVLDLLNTDGDGRNLLIRLRDNSRTAQIPVFVMSSLDSVQVRTECLALGADEYLAKPVDPDYLTAAVSARLKRVAERSRELHRDTLTGARTRAGLHDLFTAAQATTARAQQPMSLALIDLDSFKSINDNFGHAMGDEVLVRITRILAEAGRASDVVGRWGGDELVMLFPNAALSGAARVLAKARVALQGEEFVAGDGRFLHPTFSAGVDLVTPGSSLADAVAQTDRYLYLAKAAGRNCVVSSDESSRPARQRILVAEDDETQAELLTGILDDAGFDVIRAEDGEVALRLALETSVALVLLDVGLPKLDGFEVLRQLRTTHAVARLPIVMLTAAGEERNIVRGFELGADDYIVKPFSTPELVARIRRRASGR